MYPAIHHQVVAAGVEEEFHIVDLATRRLAGQAGSLMEQLPAGIQRKTFPESGPLCEQARNFKVVCPTWFFQ